MGKPIVVRNCQKHGMQIFYESVLNCMGFETFQYRCVMCKHEYYERNAERIKRRNGKNGARNQAAYRRRIKSEAIRAYSTTSSCAVCGESDFELLVVIDANGLSQSHAWLKRSGYPSGFAILCRKCKRAIKSG